MMAAARTDPAFALFQAATAEAIDSLETHQANDARVNAARKALKRARAALRLLHPVLSADAYERENLTLRDVGRYLSPLRDAQALYGAIDLLEGGQGNAETINGALAILRKTLSARVVQARRDLADAGILRKCASLVMVCRERLQHPDAANDETSLEGFGRIYRKAREAFAEAQAAPTPEALHEWHKHTKYLHFAAAGLRGSGVAHLQKVTEQSHDIASWLRDDRALVGLRKEVTRMRINDHEASALIDIIDERREQLQRQAVACGATLFRKKPERFIERLRLHGR